MITGQEGGFVHRLMPPADWCCGQIPVECYDKSLTMGEISKKLESVYLTEDGIRKLAESNDESAILWATLSLELLAEIDSETIWFYNNFH